MGGWVTALKATLSFSAKRDSGCSCDRTSLARWLSNPLPWPMNAVMGSIATRRTSPRSFTGLLELVQVFAKQEQFLTLIAPNIGQ